MTAQVLCTYTLKLLEDNNLDPNLMTAIIGDNTSLMPSLAREISNIHPHVEFGGCGAHMTNLVSLGIKEFSQFKPLFQDLHTCMRPAGSEALPESLRRVGLVWKKLMYYQNRFGSSIDVVTYGLENFDTLHDWAMNDRVVRDRGGVAHVLARTAW